MALPRITNPFGGVVVPAVAEQRYDDLFFATLVVNARPDNNHMSVQFMDYNYETKTFAPGGQQHSLSVPDFWAWAEAPAANAEQPTLRQQWLGLGVQLGLLEVSLEKAQVSLAAAQTALATALAAEDAAEQQLAVAQVADPIDQVAVETAQATLTAAAQAVTSATATKSAAQAAVDAIKAQLNIA